MEPAEQYVAFGAAVEPQDGMVILQVGHEIAALTPLQAQRFAFHLARAYVQAAGGARRSSGGTFTIGGPR